MLAASQELRLAEVLVPSALTAGHGNIEQSQKYIWLQLHDKRQVCTKETGTNLPADTSHSQGTEAQSQASSSESPLLGWALVLYIFLHREPLCVILPHRDFIT